VVVLDSRINVIGSDDRMNTEQGFLTQNGKNVIGNFFWFLAILIFLAIVGLFSGWIGIGILLFFFLICKG
jgi:hypothetical protein